MSLRAMLWALHDAPTQDPAEVLILIALADHAADDGSGSWPGHALLARRARCSVSTVQRVLRRLEESGLIKRGEQGIAAHVRADRRPVVWDLAVTAGQIDRPVRRPSTAGQNAPHDRSPVTDEPRTNQGRTGGGEVQTSPHHARPAPPDGPAPRPLSPQARETLRVREQQQAARAHAAEVAERRRADRLGMDPVPASST